MSNRQYKIKRIKMNDVEIVDDEAYDELVKNVQDNDYRSFSDYFQKELIYPHIYYASGFNSPSLCLAQIDYFRLRRKLLELNKNNMHYLDKLAKDKDVTITDLIAMIINKYFKAMETKNDKK